ncbi:MAG: CehA/McbA family metallohydrolase [Armatimonadota bacterium]
MRVDRVLSLAGAGTYPGSAFIDMVVFLGCFQGEAVRVWLLSAAEKPVLRIEEGRFEAGETVGEGPEGMRWVDMGVAEDLPGRFGQLRVEGMTVQEAREALVLFTRDLDFVPEGSREDVEEALFGISRPNAGRTTLTPSRVEVGEPTEFETTYIAGPRGLPGGALVRFSIPRAWSPPQTHDAQAPGFVSVEAVGERDGRRLPVDIVSADLSDESHEEFDVVCSLPEGLGPGDRVVVRYQTEEMYIFPWLRYEVERPLWFAHLVPFAAAVAVDQRRQWVSLLPENSHSFETVAGPAERLDLVLPGRVHEDEEVILRGIFTDRYRNVPRTRGVPVDIRLRILDEDGERDLGRPRGKFEAPHRFRMSLGKIEEGIYRVRAYDRTTGEPLAQSNPLEVLDDDDERLNVYWGEIHGHTEMSDGIGAFEEMFRHARDEGCQDFAAAADHACYFTDNEWEWMQDTANALNERGAFVTLLGYEWAGRQGHRCIYARGRRLELFRGMSQAQSSLDVVYKHFHGNEDVVAGPHHTGAAGRMEHHDPTIERFIEVYSMWGASDRLGAPKAPLFPGSKPLPADEWLNRGAKLGFTGGGDCHEGRSGWTVDDPHGQGSALHGFAHQLRYRCGLTAALMPELRRRHLIAALRERRTWATTGARILLDFRVSDVEMGQEGEADEAEVEAVVHGAGRLRRLEIIRDGDVVWTEEVDGLDVELEWTDPEKVGESTWYYLHVIQEDGQEAWSSPVWLTGD